MYVCLNLCDADVTSMLSFTIFYDIPAVVQLRSETESMAGKRDIIWEGANELYNIYILT